MNTRCTGFILLMTLGIIAVINLLLLTSMHYLLLYYKATNQEEIRHSHFYQLEEVALNLTGLKSATAKNCIEREKSANTVMQDLINNGGCSLVYEHSSYRYLIEDLGEFPCLVVETDSKTLGTRHMRISVLLAADETNAASFLQLRYIIAGAHETCQGEPRVINPGVSSWRYLASV